MIAIIDYQAGNIQSVQNAFKRLNVETILTSNKGILEKAERIIFPGVGDAAYAMDSLLQNDLVEFIPKLNQPVLGICLGMQLLCESTEEGNIPCLGIFNTKVKRFAPVSFQDKVPHMGWNNHRSLNSELFKGIGCDEDFYFVHSYYAESNRQTIAECEYLLPFASAMKKDNFYATQFHPEKSASLGEKLLLNFLEI